MERLWYFVQFGDFFKNERGLKSFVLQRNQVALDNIERKTGIRMGNKKRSKYLDATDYANVYIPDHVYKEKKRKLRVYTIILVLAIIAELVLNYISTMIFLEGNDLIILIFRIATTIVLTMASIMVADKLFEAIFINDKLRDIEIYRLPEIQSSIPENYQYAEPEHSVFNGSPNFDNTLVPADHYQQQLNYQENVLHYKKRNYTNKIPVLIIFMLILEFAVVAIADVRAKDFEGERWTLLYMGFIFFAMGLPLIAGYVKMELDRDRVIVDAYKRNLVFRNFRMNSPEHNKVFASKFEEKFKKILRKESRRQFVKIHKFKTFKENFDLSHGKPVEPLEEIEFIDNLESYTYFLYTHTGIAENW
ncbi:MAG: hypothetical protein AAF694_20980 [Bacteroidota bacterium]